MLVYIVGFQPADVLDAAIGGFDWFPGSERKAAVERMLECVNDGDSHSVTFVPMNVPKNDKDDVTEWIEKHLDLVEVGRR